MERALLLARRGRGRTSPNPMVGAVVVDDGGVVVGAGYHERAGGPHAEVAALEAAGGRARGATLYCTLEPCCHTGRTGPCTARIAQAGIRRVVFASRDPNPRVSGGGHAELRRSGVEVTEGVCEEASRRLNAAFFTWIRTGRPHVVLKAAVTIDNRVAGAGGARLAITSAAANRRIHRDRAAVDAIAVGSSTVLADDPLLTARGAYRERPLARVIFDRRLRTPPTARVLSTAGSGPVIVVTTGAAVASDPGRARALERAGAELDVTGGAEGLAATLERLGTREITSLVVEGGPTLQRAFCEARLVDAVQIFVAPDRAPGEDGPRWLAASELPAPAMARVRQYGRDALVEYVYRPD